MISAIRRALEENRLGSGTLASQSVFHAGTIWTGNTTNGDDSRLDMRELASGGSWTASGWTIDMMALASRGFNPRPE